MKVAVFGLGYVRTVTAACLASHGHDVWGVDVGAAKVDEVRAGRSPVAEPGLDTLTAQAVADGALHAATSCFEAPDRAEVSLVCGGTPSGAGGATDLSYIRRSVDGIVGAMRAVTPPASGHNSVVIRSTVPPGTATNELMIGNVVDRIVAGGGWTVALLGLSYKADTDDLRESPNAELAERLIGKGFDVRIYDPVVHPDLRSGRSSGQADRRRPAGHRGEAAPPETSAHPHAE